MAILFCRRFTSKINHTGTYWPPCFASKRRNGLLHMIDTCGRITANKLESRLARLKVCRRPRAGMYKGRPIGREALSQKEEWERERERAHERERAWPFLAKKTRAPLARLSHRDARHCQRRKAATAWRRASSRARCASAPCRAMTLCRSASETRLRGVVVVARLAVSESCS